MLLWNSFILNIVVIRYKGIFLIKTRIVLLRSKSIINRNHVCYALNDKIYVVFFFRYSYKPLLSFSLNFYCWCLSSSCTSFFMGYLCLLDMFLLCSAFFLVSLPLQFFSSFYFTAYPFTINRFLFACDFQ